MTIVKLCGLSTPDSVRAAIEGGADYLGFVFFPPSPRSVTPIQAAELGATAPKGVHRVGLFVDAEDDDLTETVKAANLTMVQLHGHETPKRVAEVKAMTGLPVIKAIGISDKADLDKAQAYDGIADMLMFDAKPDPNKGDKLPGGNARTFDWTLLSGAGFKTPWFLAGGLTPDNVADAIHQSGAQLVDVSSGVEAQRGVKDVDKIAAFLQAAKSA